MLSVESQKGAIAIIQRCSVENQKGAIINRLCTAIVPFWFSIEHLWMVIAPFCRSLNWRCMNYQPWNCIIIPIILGQERFLWLFFNFKIDKFESVRGGGGGGGGGQTLSGVCKKFAFYFFFWILSVESQKSVKIAVERCSIENQKGAIAVQSLWP